METEKGSVRLWAAKTGKLSHSFAIDNSVFLDLAFSPNGKRLVAGTGDGMAHVWDVVTGTELHRLSAFRGYTGYQGFITDIDYSPNGRFIATSTLHGKIIIWDADKGNIINTINYFEAEETESTFIKFSPDSKHLLIGTMKAGSGLIDVATGYLLADLTAVAGSANWIDYTSDGKTFLVFGSGASIWRAFPNGQELIELARKTVRRALTEEERELYGINK